MPVSAKHKAILRYAAKMRNTDKRWYAITYGMAKLYGHSPPSRPKGLSHMAAQAVEMEVREILQSTAKGQ